tara:strand:- start:57 stop:1679 length:1623 start_codon:yes stop_codon:yes gene_type:complete
VLRVGDVVDFLSFGTPTGTDDTALLLSAVTTSVNKVLHFPPLTIATDMLNIPSNSHWVLSAQTLLKATTGYGANDSVLELSQTSNITIDGNHATVQMIKAEYVTGEQRHGVRMVGASKVKISNLHSTDTGGDGFYIGTFPPVTPCSDIELLNCFSDGAKRNGLSIVSGKNVWVRGGAYENTVGTAPEFGVDIEPNVSTDMLENINLIGVKTTSNTKGGIQVVLGGLGETAKTYVSVNIVNCTSVTDGRDGSLRFANPAAFKISGSVNVDNFTSINPAGRGIDFANQSLLNPQTNLNNVTVINPAFSLVSPGNVDKSGLSLYTSTNNLTLTTGNISISNLKVIDNRVTPLVFSGIYLGGAYPTDNITLKNITVETETATLVPKVIFAGDNTNIGLSSDNPQTILFTAGAGDIDRYSVGDIIDTTSGSTITLGSASSKLGAVITYKPTTTTTKISPLSGDTFFFFGLPVSIGVFLEPRDSITIRAVTGGWELINSSFPLKTGSGSPVNIVSTRYIGREYFDTVGANHWLSTGTTSADWKVIT